MVVGTVGRNALVLTLDVAFVCRAWMLLCIGVICGKTALQFLPRKLMPPNTVIDILLAAAVVPPTDSCQGLCCMNEAAPGKNHLSRGYLSVSIRAVVLVRSQ